MPLSSSILWKNSFQYSNYNLLSVEQFQLGGISNVRGYAPATYAGDQGLSSTLEWSFPAYFLPKSIKVPFSKAKFYDVTRFVAFYDIGHADLRSPTATEQNSMTLQGWGYGVRLNLPEAFFARVEYAYPINPKGVGGDGNLYWDVSKKF
jgi:hemolysin activation/secretion protein